MNKKGFTLIEIIVSIVLVSVILVSLLASLIQLRKTYTVIHEDSDILVYSSSISRVINNDLSINNGIKYSTCSADGQECDIILGNNDRRNLKIIKKCYVDGREITCNQENNNKEEIIRTTLKYMNNTKETEKLVYIRTLELKKYNNNGNITTKGYNFADMSTTRYEHDVDNTKAKIDQYTTILIRLNNEVNEDIRKHDVTLYTAGRYDYSNLLGKTYKLELNSNGAEKEGTTKIDEVFGVGYFLTEDNHTVKKQIKKIEIPQNGDKAFLGYYYRQAGNTQEIQVIDSTGYIITSSRFFRENVKYNYDNDENESIILAKWGDCTNGYVVEDGRCVPKEYKVTLNPNGGIGADPFYMVKYLSVTPNTKVPHKDGYKFNGFYNGSTEYNDENGTGVFVYNLTEDTTATAKYTECPNGYRVVEWKPNNKCEIEKCADGYFINDKGEYEKCEGETYTAKFYENGATSISFDTATCTVTNEAGTCTVEAPTITRAGFEIKGWNTNKNAKEGFPSLTINKDTDFFAITHKNVALTFYKNGNTSQTPKGGSRSTASSIIEKCDIWNVATKCSITSPKITPPSGFTTIGYSTGANSYTKSWDENTTKSLNSDASYYAQSSKKYNVTYIKGKHVTGIGSENGSCTVYNGTSSCNVTLPSITAASGYTSVGWSTTNGATSGIAAGKSYSINGDTRLYANAIGRPKVVVSAFKSDNSKIRDAVTFTADGEYVASSNWINTNMYFKISATSEDGTITKIDNSWNKAGYKTDTGNDYSGGSTTYTSGFDNIKDNYSAEGYRTGKLVVTDSNGKTTTVRVVIKIDKTNPYVSYSLSGNTASATCGDALSGYKSGNKRQNLSNNSLISGTCTDNAGNIHKYSKTYTYGACSSYSCWHKNSGLRTFSDITQLFVCKAQNNGLCPNGTHYTTQASNKCSANSCSKCGQVYSGGNNTWYVDCTKKRSGCYSYETQYNGECGYWETCYNYCWY